MKTFQVGQEVRATFSLYLTGRVLRRLQRGTLCVVRCANGAEYRIPTSDLVSAVSL